LATVRILRSTTAGNTPASLVSGQIAINEGDGKLFYRNASGVVTQLASGGGSVITAATVSAFPATGSSDGVLYVATDTGRAYIWAGAYLEIGSSGGGSGLTWSSVPASENAAGTAGQIAYDSKYQYTCVAQNNWLRSPLLPWLPVTSGLQMNLDASFAPSLFQNSNGTTAAASADNPVGYWADMSGLGNHAIQATSGSRPLLKINNQNGLPGLYLDGTDDCLTATIAGFQSLTATTILMVAKPAAAAAADTNAGVFCAFGNTGGGSGVYPSSSCLFLSHSAGAISGEYLTIGYDRPIASGRLGSSSYRRSASQAIAIAATFSESGTQVFQNNSSVTLDLASGTTTSTVCSPSQIGYTVDNDLHLGAVRAAGVLAGFAAMTIHQVLVYDRVLSSDERTSLWNYLSAKWGIA